MRLTNKIIDMAKAAIPTSKSMQWTSQQGQEEILFSCSLPSDGNKVVLSGYFILHVQRPTSDGYEFENLTFAIDKILTQNTYDENGVIEYSKQLWDDTITFEMYMEDRNTIKASLGYGQTTDQEYNPNADPCRVTITEILSENLINIDSSYTFVKGDISIGGDVSIGGSLTIPSNENITINELQSGSILIKSMTGGVVTISNKTSGTVIVNGIVIEEDDSGDSGNSIITIPRGDKASSMVSGGGYYVPEQSVTDSSYTFTIPECVIKGGSEYNAVVYSLSLTSASITYSLVVYNNKIQIAKHTVAPYTDMTTYSDIVSYYKTNIEFM